MVQGFFLEGKMDSLPAPACSPERMSGWLDWQGRQADRNIRE